MKALARRGVVRVPGGWATPSDRRFDIVDKILGLAACWCLLTAGWLFLLLILVLTDSFRS